MYDATLATSFDADYEMFYGTDSAVMLRGNKAWMFKEVDAPLLGWEVYARKDEFYRETGIALVANATKLVAQGNKPVEEAPYSSTPLHYALESFITNTGALAGGVEDFTASFGNDPKAPDIEGWGVFFIGQRGSLQVNRMGYAVRPNVQTTTNRVGAPPPPERCPPAPQHNASGSRPPPCGSGARRCSRRSCASGR